MAKDRSFLIKSHAVSPKACLKIQLLSLLLQPANTSGSGKGPPFLTPGRTPGRSAGWDETSGTAPEPQWDFLVGRFWLVGDLSIYHQWDVVFEGEELNISSLLFCPLWFPEPRNFKLRGWFLVEQWDVSVWWEFTSLSFSLTATCGALCHDCGLQFTSSWISSLSGTCSH